MDYRNEISQRTFVYENVTRKPMVLHGCVCIEGCVSVLVWVHMCMFMCRGQMLVSADFPRPLSILIYSFLFFFFSLILKPINLEDLLDNELQGSVPITHAHNGCYLSPPLCPDLYISSAHTNSHSYACTVSILPNESLLQP